MEISAKDKIIKFTKEENKDLIKYNQNLKDELYKLKDLLNRKDDTISDLKERIGQIELNNSVI